MASSVEARAGGVGRVGKPSRGRPLLKALEVVPDHFLAGARDQGSEGGDVDPLVDETDRAVAEDGVDPAGVETVDLSAAIHTVDRVRIRGAAHVLAVGAVDPAQSWQNGAVEG